MTSPHRLSRSEFPIVPRDAYRGSSPLFTVSRFRTAADVPPKLGVIVSKKVSIRAVKRNLMRRRIRAVLLPRLRELPQGTVLIVHVRKECLGAVSADIRAEIARLLGA